MTTLVAFNMIANNTDINSIQLFTFQVLIACCFCKGHWTYFIVFRIIEANFFFFWYCILLSYKFHMLFVGWRNHKFPRTWIWRWSDWSWRRASEGSYNLARYRYLNVIEVDMTLKNFLTAGWGRSRKCKWSGVSSTRSDEPTSGCRAEWTRFRGKGAAVISEEGLSEP